MTYLYLFYIHEYNNNCVFEKEKRVFISVFYNDICLQRVK
jgi:hypothetical protein